MAEAVNLCRSFRAIYSRIHNPGFQSPLSRALPPWALLYRAFSATLGCTASRFQRHHRALLPRAAGALDIYVSAHALRGWTFVFAQPEPVVSFCCEMPIPAPQGAAENSPGREPGVRITKLESPEGATPKPIRRINCAAPSGLNICFHSTPGSRPGLFSAGPPGLSREFRDRN